MRSADLEEPKLVGVVADQHVLGLLIVVQHHLVRLAPDAGLLVAAKGRMGGIGVIVVDPDPASLESSRPKR